MDYIKRENLDGETYKNYTNEVPIAIESTIQQYNQAEGIHANLMEQLRQNGLTQSVIQGAFPRIMPNLLPKQREQQYPEVILNDDMTNSNIIDNHRQDVVQDRRVIDRLRFDSSLIEDGRSDTHGQFQIKSETQENEELPYYYDYLTHNLVSATHAASVNQLESTSQSIQQSQHLQLNENTAYVTQYNPNLNLATNLANSEFYQRQQNFFQMYLGNTMQNAENLVMNKDFSSSSSYESDKKAKSDQDLPGEKYNQNKYPYESYTDYYQKSENDSSAQNKIEQDSQEFWDFVCGTCNKVFSSRRNLSQHERKCPEGLCAQDSLKNCDSIDKGERGKNYSCEMCNYKCQSPAILKIHERTHSGEKPFSCTFCEYKSGQKNNVAKHILTHMKEKPFRCQFCNYRCAQKNNLVIHERTHTGVKPFACTYCDYKTVQKPNLVKHIYLHTNEKPFSCDLCSYKCVQKTNLMKHKQRHMNDKDCDPSKQIGKISARAYKPRERSFKCTICNYKCVQKVSLEKHIQFNHSDTKIAEVPVDAEVLDPRVYDQSEQVVNLMKGSPRRYVQNFSLKKDESIAYSNGLNVENIVQIEGNS